MGEAYLLWESLRPVRSVIIAAAAVEEIEDLACSEFDNNRAYFDEMVSLYSNLKIEQGNDAIESRRFLLLIIQGLQEVIENETLCTIYLYPKFQNNTLTLDLLKDDIIICDQEPTFDPLSIADNGSISGIFLPFFGFLGLLVPSLVFFFFFFLFLVLHLTLLSLHLESLRHGQPVRHLVSSSIAMAKARCYGLLTL
jgi:hypothetical protein